MNQTKEQLIIELAKLRQSHEGWVSGDEQRRKEFEKAFNWEEPKEFSRFGGSEVATLSWEQIFVKVGKLLTSKNFMNRDLEKVLKFL